MGGSFRDRQRLTRAVAVALAVVAVIVLLGVVLLVLPGLMVDHDLAGGHLAAADRLNAVNNVRTTLLQTVGGAVVLFGACATWRQLRVSQDGLNATREGNITDRFSRAVDQLGSDKLDVRIGGIYALWRLADHSDRDREAVVSIMAAYLRTHLPWPPQEPTVPAADASINSVPPLETRAADAQTALTCLGVLYQERRPEWLNVSSTDLRRADCDGLWLHGANFDGACMEAASVYQVNLSKASLIAANLRHAELGTSILHQVRCLQADLRGARLVKADLRSADFTRADLREANLRKTRAQGAVLAGADLRLADLRGCDLTDADLQGARLEGALASDLTIWPAGFNARTAGVVVTADPGIEPDNLLPAAALTRRVPLLRSEPRLYGTALDIDG
ncbi:pentapeptide repeat-containing protein [Streptomyces collinus]|uniref:pentapeptide repeat-containing protein n=1 Tax=Streptomyces collinus TaxID=42684 RepID=UPI000693EA33|nr:pentapeptide repeat-containing protein [Streptomyces collinus]UJA11028.1 pentapeptide repeat-containing protein [Streptomyces collinus]UJA14108.1 pentapeptide repeat-containing protein [Streptomyces collinus]